MGSKTLNWWSLTPSVESEESMLKAFRSQKLSYGPVGKEVESLFQKFFSVNHVQLFSSGTTALISALASLNLKPDDEILIPQRTFVAPLNAAQILGLKIKLIRSEPMDTRLSLESLKASITEKTKAVCMVHLNGRIGQIREISEFCKSKDIFLIEDCSQAFDSEVAGQKLGTFGDIGTFSFGVTKAMTCGQGGMAITNSSDIASRLDHYIFQGRENLSDTEFKNPGGNFRLSDLLSAQLIPQLNRWEERKKSYQKIFDFYRQIFKTVKPQAMTLLDSFPGELPVWVEVLCEDRKKISSLLQEKNIQVQFLPEDLSKIAYAHWSEKPNLPNTLFHSQGLILPCGPDFLTEDNQFRMREALKSLAL